MVVLVSPGDSESYQVVVLVSPGESESYRWWSGVS